MSKGRLEANFVPLGWNLRFLFTKQRFLKTKTSRYVYPDTLVFGVVVVEDEYLGGELSTIRGQSPTL